jgi:hypothetical protein
MSTVGKALVVAQLAFSVLLMAFAAGVSSVQTNWHDAYKKTDAELKKTQGDLNTLRDQKKADDTAHDGQVKSLKDAAAKAEGLAAATQQKNQQLGTQLTQARTELENVRAEAKIAADEARARRDEAVTLRAINDQLHKKSDELLALSRSQADKLVNLEQDARSMVEKHNQTLADMAVLQKFIRLKGFEGDPKEVAGLSEPPPVVEAIVLDTKKGSRGGSDLVVISMGSDHGLAKGNEMYVYRADGKGKYLGKIRLDYVDYRTSVGVVIQSTKNGEIQKGDNVTTKL